MKSYESQSREQFESQREAHGNMFYFACRLNSDTLSLLKMTAGYCILQNKAKKRGALSIILNHIEESLSDFKWHLEQFEGADSDV